jgi:hypothetical protein
MAGSVTIDQNCRLNWLFAGKEKADNALAMTSLG